jgi:D-serine deaminase-like pyridoxal phosphate-dependent protein
MQICPSNLAVVGCFLSLLKNSETEMPALPVDLGAMEQKRQTMALSFRERSAKQSPHFKNHPVLELAAGQMEHDAIGITCAKPWQAVKLVNAGKRSILIANEVAGDAPLERFAELSAEATVLIAIDNELVVADLARLARGRND